MSKVYKFNNQPVWYYDENYDGSWILSPTEDFNECVHLEKEPIFYADYLIIYDEIRDKTLMLKSNYPLDTQNSWLNGFLIIKDTCFFYKDNDDGYIYIGCLTNPEFKKCICNGYNEPIEFVTDVISMISNDKNNKCCYIFDVEGEIFISHSDNINMFNSINHIPENYEEAVKLCGN